MTDTMQGNFSLRDSIEPDQSHITILLTRDQLINKLIEILYAQ